MAFQEFDVTMDVSRRTFLRAIGTAPLFGLAGCTSTIPNQESDFTLCDSARTQEEDSARIDGRWPMSRFDAGNTASNPAGEGVTDAVAAWVAEIGGQPTFDHGALFSLERQLHVRSPYDGSGCANVASVGHAAGYPPTVVGEYVYVLTFTGLTAISIEDMTIEWQRGGFTNLESPPIVHNGHVIVVAARDDDEFPCVYAYSVSDGTRTWRYAVGESFEATPGVSSSTVYATTANAIHAIDIETGAEQFVLEEGGFDTRIPVVTEDLLVCLRYIGDAGDELVGIDTKDGVVRWRHALGVRVSAPPVVQADAMLTNSDEGVVHIDPGNGKRVETVYRPGGTPLAVVGNVIYARSGSAGEQVLALTLGGEELWSFETGAEKRGDEVNQGVRTITPVNGAVFVSAADGVYAFTSN